ncbi:MAG: energy-coupling factor transporter transmembrane protein EcfT [Acidimicrobiia bacterium]|nr:energy-coupling factor transporter transmembrane protein EcfT [Acidimicrobiia bacterium]
MSGPPLHALTWLVWALAGAAAVQLAPSPVYVAVVIALAALLVEVHAGGGPLARAFPLLVGLGVAFGLVRVVLTAATTHGVGDVLFTTPAVTLPRILGGFTVGGTVELPVVLQAASEAFVIVGLMAVFGAFNAVVSHDELVRSSPRAFHELGLIVTVAIAFVPSTIEAVRAVREADRARTGGRAVRRGRLLRLAVPILESGMERAVHLAESMDSRGFARGDAGRADRLAAWCGMGSLLALAGAFVALVGRARPAAAALGLAGLALLVAAVALASAGSPRTHHRRRLPGRADWAVAGASVLTPAGLAVLALTGDGSLTWTASPLRWPTFGILPALTLAGLLAPLALRPSDNFPVPEAAR